MNNFDELKMLVKKMQQEAYDSGLKNGLSVAEKIVGWLSRQPDRKWQREVRGWSEEEIMKCKKLLGTKIE